MCTKKIKLVAVAKDEAAYLAQWIHHHLYFGFSEIDIYINRTTDNSTEILELISKQYPNVRFFYADWVDKLPEASSKHIQHISYMQAVNNNTDCDYIMFLDVDEYWVCRDFSTSISEYISRYADFDAMVFEWFNENRTEKSFALFESTLSGKLHQLGKSIIKMPNKISKIRLHVPEMEPDSNIILADGTYFKSSNALPQHVSHDLNSLKDAFILHRMHRSEVEYLASLYRGNPELDFPIKLNRQGHGYDENDPAVKLLKLDYKKHLDYQLNYEEFKSSCKLEPHFSEAKNNIILNAKKLMPVLANALEKKPNAVKSVLKFIQSPNVLAILNGSIPKQVVKRKDYNKRRIILHIGAHKTGTTSIQKALFKARRELKNMGVIYADLNKRDANHSIMIYDACINNPENPANIRKLDENSLSNVKAQFHSYLSHIENNKDWHSLIFSGESMSTMSIDMLINLKNTLEHFFTIDITVECIYFVRNPYDYFRSSLQERIKRDSLQKILNSGFPNANLFKGTIHKFRTVFGTDSLLVINFDEAIKSRVELTLFFLTCVFKNEMCFKHINFMSQVQNASISNEAFEILDFLNSHAEYQGGFRDISSLLNIKGLPKFTLSEELTVKINDRAAIDINYLSQSHNINYPINNFNDKNEAWRLESINLLGNAIHKLPRHIQLQCACFLNKKIQDGSLNKEVKVEIGLLIKKLQSKRVHIKSQVRFIFINNKILHKAAKLILNRR